MWHNLQQPTLLNCNNYLCVIKRILWKEKSLSIFNTETTCSIMRRMFMLTWTRWINGKSACYLLSNYWMRAIHFSDEHWIIHPDNWILPMSYLYVSLNFFYFFMNYFRTESQGVSCILLSTNIYSMLYHAWNIILCFSFDCFTITHCLGLGHETMVSAVCLSIFLLHIVWNVLSLNTRVFV